MFRVGDIVERTGGNFGNVRNGDQVEIHSYTFPHLHLENDGHIYASNGFKLIKPVWKIGDTAKVILPGETQGDVYTVVKVEGDFIYQKSDIRSNISYSSRNVERIALAPESPMKIAFDQATELRTTLARETEIPTYLYDLVDVKPRLIPGKVDQLTMASGWSVNLEVVGNGNVVSMHNIDHISLDAERLRKLAKLCSDLADLMG